MRCAVVPSSARQPTSVADGFDARIPWLMTPPAVGGATVIGVETVHLAEIHIGDVALPVMANIERRGIVEMRSIDCGAVRQDRRGRTIRRLRAAVWRVI